MTAQNQRATIAVGHGRYADPWHPYDEIAARLAALLVDDGWQVTVDEDVDGAMTRLTGQDLLVVAAGDPWGLPAPHFGAPKASIAGLSAALDQGIGVLALHSAASSLRDYPAWAPALGAIWVPGASMHPPFEERASVRIRDHRLTRDLGEFAIADERYSWLQPTGEREVLVEHTQDGVVQPLVWVRRYGMSRIVYDGLGHDTRSLDSAAHRELLRRLATWAGAFDKAP